MVANRQLRSWPSAVSRTRSQSAQNGRVTEPTTPTRGFSRAQPARSGPSSTAQVSAASLLAFAPIFFAGVVFAVSFTRAAAPDRAFGFNIAGAMVGGLAEYSSMVLGFQHLLFVAVALYTLSILGHQKVVIGAPAAHIGHDAAG